MDSEIHLHATSSRDPISRTASKDAAIEIEEEVKLGSPEEVVGELPTNLPQQKVQKQARTVSHQHILTVPESGREMTLTKKAMQVASIHGPASKGKKKLGGPNNYYRKSEAKPILKELEEEKKVLNRTKSEI